MKLQEHEPGRLDDGKLQLADGAADGGHDQFALPDVPADHHVDHAGASREPDAAGKRVIEVPLQKAEGKALPFQLLPQGPVQCTGVDNQEVDVGGRPGHTVHGHGGCTD